MGLCLRYRAGRGLLLSYEQTVILHNFASRMSSCQSTIAGSSEQVTLD